MHGKSYRITGLSDSYYSVIWLLLQPFQCTMHNAQCTIITYSSHLLSCMSQLCIVNSEFWIEKSVLRPLYRIVPLFWECCPPSSLSSLKMSFLDSGEIGQKLMNWKIEGLKDWRIEKLMDWRIEELKLSVLPCVSTFQSFNLSILFGCFMKKL